MKHGYLHIPPETMRLAAKGMEREAEKMQRSVKAAAESPLARHIEAVMRRLASL